MLWRDLHPSWCFYAGMVGVIFGVALATALQLTFFANFLWCAAGGMILFATFYFAKRAILLFAFCAGALLGAWRVGGELAGQQILASYVGETITISGQLAEAPEFANGQTTLRLKNLQLGEQEIAGVLYAKLAGTKFDLLRSDAVALEGKLGAGFGTFAGTMYRADLKNLARAEPGDVFAKLGNWFAAQVKKFIAAPAAELGLGYLIGQKSGLPKDLLDAMSAIGMTHVIVASGTHLGIIVGLTKKLFGKLSKFAGVFFALLLVAAFVMLIGFTPSMTRAALVTSLSLVFGFVGRKFTPLRLLFFVAALTLLIAPGNIIHLGWQLSFASFFGILIFAPRLTKTLYGGKHPPWLAEMLTTSIATTLVCAPILIYNFGQISLLALVANLIILPTLPYAMLLVFLTGALSFAEFGAQICGFCATKLLEFHIFVVNLLSEQKVFILELPAGNFAFFALYVPILIFLIWPQISPKQRKAATQNLENVL